MEARISKAVNPSSSGMEPAENISVTTGSQQEPPICAVERVLNINELLLQIFEILDWKGIRKARSVCRHWKNLIEHTALLRFRGGIIVKKSELIRDSNGTTSGVEILATTLLNRRLFRAWRQINPHMCSYTACGLVGLWSDDHRANPSRITHSELLDAGIAANPFQPPEFNLPRVSYITDSRQLVGKVLFEWDDPIHTELLHLMRKKARLSLLTPKKRDPYARVTYGELPMRVFCAYQKFKADGRKVWTWRKSKVFWELNMWQALDVAITLMAAI